MKDAPFETWQQCLRPDDFLFLYTDGVTEARNASGGLFDSKGLEAALRRGQAAGTVGPMQPTGISSLALIRAKGIGGSSISSAISC